MKTPIFDFLKAYAKRSGSRLHMPGHKGKKFLGAEKYDITEISGADSLFEAKGIIKESEENATRVFGSLKTLYCAEGSTQSIKAMLYLALKNRKNKDNRPVIAATRNAHKAFIYGCALLDIDIFWLYSESNNFSLCECKISAEDIKKAINDSGAFAVYVTSPDYLGNMLDIKGIADIVHKFDIPLLVDNAHGAYLNFLEDNIHPINLGADMCSDSAHKTLPVLTGGAYLHIGNEKYAEDSKNALSLFCSTSPSYLILASLDLANSYLDKGYKEKLSKFIKKLEGLKALLKKRGFCIVDSDPLKLTVKNFGTPLSKELKKHKIEWEYESSDFTVLMFTPENSNRDIKAVAKALTTPPKEKENTLFAPHPERVYSPREALLKESETVDIEKAEGRILADVSVSCPPAVPVLISGEKVDKKAIEVFKFYGIDKINVIK